MDRTHNDSILRDAANFADILRGRAAADPHRVAFEFLADGDGPAPAPLTYGALDRRARSISAHLRESGLAGERAVMLFPPGLDFVAAFFGCLDAGAVGVPAHLPRPNRPMDRLRSIVADARPRAVLTTAAQRADAARWADGVPELAGVEVIATDEVEEVGDSGRGPAARPDGLAFLQYTSGSTAAPKGVMVTHANLRHNSALIAACFGSTSESRGVFWLPLFHDMGLIGGVLQTVYCGGRSALMSPVAFLQRPLRWLEAISRTGATISGGPNFAYDQCARKISPEQRAGLDLSRWSVAFNGAEPVRAETLDRFAEAFAPCGFRREAFLPCYGLAESTLLVSGRRRSGPVVVGLDTQALEAGRAAEGEARLLVGCGEVPAGLEVVVADPETGDQCPSDSIGEIWVRGASVASGYWERPEATAATFGARLMGDDSGPYLRTGDLGFRRDGQLFVTGRLKDLIVVRGRNVYPQDIEWTAERSHPALRAEGAAAFAVEAGGEERLVVVAEVERPGKKAAADEIIAALRGAVAEQHELDLHAVRLIRPLTLPKTSSGKVQRHACRAAFLDDTLEVVGAWNQAVAEPEMPAICEQEEARDRPSARAIEDWLAARIAGPLGIAPGEIDVRQPFASFGLGSLQAVSLAGELERWLGRPLAPTLAYEYPTIEALAHHLAGEADPAGTEAPVAGPDDGPIAIIGIGCRFPGADGPEAFWRLMSEGRDAVGPPSANRLRAGLPGLERAGFLDEVDRFDAEFFGIAPREAARIDPQQRLLLEVAWQALEDAGQVPARLAGSPIGVFVGIATNDYGRLLGGHPDGQDIHTLTGNAASIAANRLSYAFDFRGPSLAVDTACSSSLVAIELACRSLRRGESTLALAGGVNLLLAPEVSANFARAGFLAPDGRCKAFDASADGYVRGEGAGVVVLKPLARALADGDAIYAVIRGGAINQDGRSNGLTAPSRHAQEAVLRAAYATAGVEPGRVLYVEAHGTGTPLGDPIEANALGTVLAEGRPADRPCLLGSVKTNVGHLEAAAGVAGLIKVALMLRHRTIPPSLNFAEPNPRIPFDQLPLKLARSVSDWPEGGAAVAGVSSFGFGGTNAHLVVESAPSGMEDEWAAGASSAHHPGRNGSARHVEPPVLLPISARSPESLRALARAYRDELAGVLAPSLRDLAGGAAVRREHHEHRLALVAGDTSGAVAALDAYLEGRPHSGLAAGRRAPGRRPGVVFVFTGQGGLWPGAGLDLAEQEPAFARSLDRCEAWLREHAGWSLREVARDGRLARAEFAQPVAVALQISLAEMWKSWGIEPAAIVGHSLGEVAAAHAAGVLRLEEALRLAVLRGRLMQRVAGLGATAAVGLGAEEAGRRIAAEGLALTIAAINGPSSTTLSGDPAELGRLIQALVDEGIFARLLDVDCAFHGPQMEPLRAELVAGLSGLSPGRASVPLVSTVMGDFVDGRRLDAAYWARNLREPVRFADAIATLGTSHELFIEIGPHPALGPAIVACAQARGRAAAALPTLRRGEGRAVALGSLARLYAHGLDPDWARVSPKGRPVRLPAYPWHRERHWLDRPARPILATESPSVECGERIEDWLYDLRWDEKEPPTTPARDLSGRWLIVADAGGLAALLAGRLEAAGGSCVLVDAESDPSRIEDDFAHPWRGVVHLGSLDAAGLGEATLGDLDAAERRGCGSLLRLARALAQLDSARLWVVTRGAQPVDGGPISALQAPAWGLGRSIALEQPGRWGGLIDLDPAGEPAELDRLVQQLARPDDEDQVAFRGGRRLVARLDRARVGPGEPLRLRPEGTYLITGGLGALGLGVARWMVDRGARRLVLLGRRGLPGRARWDELAPDDPARVAVVAVQAMERAGATVLPIAADVGDLGAMETVLHRLAEELPPIRGIVHAAGVVAEGTGLEDEAGELARTLRPKVAGTWVLDRLARGLPLDFFALFSSAASILGAREAGYAAANQFLDAYAHDARRRGLPAVSLNWGPWQGEGMAASTERARAQRGLGFRPIEPDAALAAFGRMVGAGVAQAAVIDADWPVLARHLRGGTARLLASLDQGESTAGEAVPVGMDRREWLVGSLREEIAAALNQRPERIEADRPLTALGIDSLTALEISVAVERRLGAALPMVALLDGVTLEGLADRMLAALDRPQGRPAAEPVAPDNGPDHPLTPGQSALWLGHQLDPEGAADVIAGAATISGAIELPALRRAFQRLVDRHPALRTTFPADDGAPVQRVHDHAEVDFAVEDAADLDEAELTRRLADEANRPFNLASGPLFRARLFRQSADRAVLMLAVHHVVSDFWSIALIVHEAARLYEGERDGRDPDLPAPELRFADFTRRQAEMLAGPEGERLWAYWRSVLDGPLPVLALPTDRPRPVLPTRRGAARTIHLDPALTPALRRLGERSGATLFATLLAGFQALLSRLSGQADIIVGSPAAGRGRPGLGELVGYFANPLPMRADLSADPTFAQLVEQVRRAALGGLEHQDFPLALMAERLTGTHAPGATPIFQAMFILQQDQLLDEGGLTPFVLHEPGPKMTLGGLAIESYALQRRAAQFDLTLMAIVADDGHIAASLNYSTDLFDDTTAARLLERYAALLAGAADGPDRRVSELPLLGPAERGELIRGWNKTACAWAEPRPVHQLFAAQAARTPDRQAVRTSAGSGLTYRELDAQSDRLARRLRALGVGREARVGLCVRRSPGMLVGLLGILKAGGAYVPLDPDFPADRLAFMAEDAGLAALVATSETHETFPGVAVPLVMLDEPVEDVGEPLHVEVVGDDLAYVLYTSGSTGRPKGVQVTHGNLTNFLLGMGAQLGIGEGDALLAVTTLSFDIAALELFLPLIAGARIELATRDEALDGSRLASRLESDQITILQATPATWRLLLEAGWRGTPGLAMLCGGEALPRDLADRLLAAGGTLWNLYGPTETTVWSTAGLVDLRKGPVSIGRPIANTQVYILDARMEPVPTGVAGELYIGGDGVARGYLNRPGLTAERFVPDPFSDQPGARLYRTGDLARWRSDGRLECLGRIDQQVKVRGFRIEPGEVEAVLGRHPGVQRAVVVARPDASGEQQLFAYLVAAQGADMPPAAELRQHLRESLPEYMIPSAFATIAALPLTPNGKIDRNTLAAIEAQETPIGAPFAEPLTPTEATVAAIWAEVLRRGQIGRHDHFFELGGHSLLAAQVASRLRQASGAEVPIRLLFEAPTVAALAERLDRDSADRARRDRTPIERVPRDRPLPLSFAQRALWFLDQLEPGRPTYNVAAGSRLIGPVDAGALERALLDLGRRHEALRTTFALVDGRPAQVIAPEPNYRLETIDLSGQESEAFDEALAQLATEQARRPFDLAAGPLLRATLARLGERGHALLLSAHHIILDGWSLNLAIRELSALYDAEVRAVPASLPELPVQYADFAAWQRRTMEGDAAAGSLAYWRGRLAGLPPLEMPTDRPRPPARSTCGDEHRFELGPELSASVRELARRAGATPFHVLLAAFQVLLGRLSGQDDFAVGTPVANREHPEVEGLIGDFVNMVALRADLSGDPSVLGLIQRVRDSTLADFEHQALPFERLLDDLQPPRDPGRTPLFQAILVLIENGLPAAELGGVTLQPLRLGAGTGTAKFDLSVYLEESPDGFAGTLEFSADLFEPATAARLVDRFRLLLEGIAARPESRISALPLLTGKERGQVLGEWAGVGEPIGEVAACVHQVFEGHARDTPAAIALIDGERRVTYAELDARANRLAHHLRSIGVGPEARVGVCLDRSAELMIALLAVLKAGGAYVPLDPDHPADRRALMLRDARVAALVTTQSRMAGLEAFAPVVVLVDADAERIAQQTAETPTATARRDDLAYVIYTSGSSGTPKGVMVPHVGLIQALHAWKRAYELGPADRHLQVAGPAFDVFTGDWVRALGTGGTLAFCPRDARLDPRALHGRLDRERITCVELVPAVAEGLLRHLEGGALRPQTLRLVAVGSDQWNAGSHRRLRAALGPSARVVNSYGLTEATIDSTFFEGDLADGDVGRPAPIGRPLAGTRVHVLDRQLQPVPPCVAGELCIGGDGVARGYLNRPALTAEKFVPDPFSTHPGARLYRTGDLARWRPDGLLELLGRIDDQVKVGGVRIEPGEIEAVLAAHPAVRQAGVVVREDAAGIRRLVAFVAGDPEELEPTALRRWLKGRLPEPMVPSMLIVREALPLSPNGKLDRRALASLDLPQAPTAEAVVAPRGPVEARLAAIVSEVLGVAAVAVDDNLFERGLDSIGIIQVVARAREAGLELDPGPFFRSPTIAELAGLISAPARADQPPAKLGPGALLPAGDWEALQAAAGDGRVIEDAYLLSPVQEGMLFHTLEAPDSGVYVEQVTCRLRGPLDAGAVASAWARLAERHPALRTAVQWLDDDRAAQVVYRAGELPVEAHDWRGLSPARQESRLAAYLLDDRRRGFVLSWAPLMRLALIRLGDDLHQLVWSGHHLVVDGWSVPILMREFLGMYEAHAAGRPVALEPARPFRDGIAWLLRQDTAASEPFWRRELAGFAEATTLGIDLAPAGASGPAVPHGERVRRLTEGETEELLAAARAARVTPGTLLLGAWALLLGRYSGRDDVAFGVAVAGRPPGLAGVESIVGMFINTLPLRVGLPGNAEVGSWLRDLQARQAALREHEASPPVLVRGWSEVPRGRPLFESVVAFENAPLDAGLSGRAGRLGVEDVRFHDQTNYPLNLTAVPGSSMLLKIGFDPRRFEASTVERLLGHLANLLAALAADPSRRLDDVPMLDAAEEQRLLVQGEADWSVGEALDDVGLDGLADDEVETLIRQLQRTTEVDER